MIKTFRDKEVEKIFNGMRSLKIDQSIQPIAYRKLKMLNSSHELKDLLVPPSNHLEKLKGKLGEKYSIRINDQYRIVFSWENCDAFEVEIVDYH